MEDLFVKWRTMWDAKELTVQLFFLANLIIAFYVATLPLRSSGKEITAANKMIMLGFGIGYAILVIVAYFQLVPTFSPYDL